MTFEELAAGLARLSVLQASVLPTGTVFAAALGNTAAHERELARRKEDDDRQRRLFLADAQDRGVSHEDAEKILALALSDDIRNDRSFGGPYDFAHAALHVVGRTGDR